MSDNIILIGMPGSGKSTVGVVLAKISGKRFIDTDLKIISTYGKTLPDIISERGYEGLLECESKIGEQLICKNSVVATGGSMVLSAPAMQNIKRLGTVVWLDVELEEIKKRVSGNMESRGIAAPVKQTIEDIYNYRLPFYQQYADIAISCNDSIEKTATAILSELKNLIKI